MSNSRRGAAALALLALAGCSAPSAARGPTLLPGGLAVRFMAARDDQVLEIRSLDRLAISAATLMLADGTRVPAYSIDAVPDPSASSDEAIDPAKLAMPGAVGGAGSGPAGIGAAPRQTTTLVGEIASAALIRVPQPADYRASWQKARVEIRLGHGADARTELLAAPPPI